MKKFIGVKGVNDEHDDRISFNVKFTEVKDVLDFVGKIAKADFDIDIKSGRYILNAKSLLAIFSLNLSSEITLIFNADLKQSVLVAKDIEKHLTEESKIALENSIGLLEMGRRSLENGNI